jgi:hypothetical protein
MVMVSIGEILFRTGYSTTGLPLSWLPKAPAHALPIVGRSAPSSFDVTAHPFDTYELRSLSGPKVPIALALGR